MLQLTWIMFDLTFSRTCRANNKGADQTAQMHILGYVFIVYLAWSLLFLCNKIGFFLD